MKTVTRYGKAHTSSLEIAKALGWQHDDFLALLLRWRGYLPASMREMIDVDNKVAYVRGAGDE